MVQALKDEDRESPATLIRQHLEAAMEWVSTAHDRAGTDAD
jgi:hypothetical protein